MVHEYGADSLRLYEMFMGPLEATKPWNMRGVEGVYRFLSRVWRLFIDDAAEDVQLQRRRARTSTPDRETLRQLHRTIQHVTDDLDGHALQHRHRGHDGVHQSSDAAAGTAADRVLETFVLLLAPFAPHVAEELWQALGHDESLAYEPWPTFDPALLRVDEIEVPVQINGKLKLRLKVPAGLDAAALEKIVISHPEVRAAPDGQDSAQGRRPARGGLVSIVGGVRGRHAGPIAFLEPGGCSL